METLYPILNSSSNSGTSPPLQCLTIEEYIALITKFGISLPMARLIHSLSTNKGLLAESDKDYKYFQQLSIHLLRDC